jgi:hypothetical protein
VKKDNFHYEQIIKFNHRRYDGILNVNNISGDELSIKDKETDEEEYFFQLKKDKTNYLLPSEQVDDLPLKVIETEKMSWRSKAYQRIYNVKSVKIGPVKTMEYKEFIDNFLPYDHLSPQEFTVWKIICDTAYRSRVNIRAISYPGWLKDSPLVILSMLRGDVSTVNKPTFAKLKYILSGKTKLLGMNEVQSLKAEEKYPLAKYYEDVGDFKPKFILDSRATHGTKEEIDISNHSSMTFYNFPKDPDETLFDDIFDPKILSRIFPIMLSGGSHTETACKETFGLINTELTDEDFEEMTAYLKTHVYFEQEYLNEIEGKDWEHGYKFGNVRWQRNFDTIAQGIKMYANNEEEFKELCGVLNKMHQNYITYINNRHNEPSQWDKDQKTEPIKEIRMSEL